MTRRLALLALLALLAIAAPASAGTYTVSACGSLGNRSWDGVAAAGIARDESCEGTNPMGNRVGGGERVPFGATGTTTFTAPAGMTIADFALTRQLTYRNGPPDQGTRRLYAIYKLGGTVFAGAGHYQHATRDRLAAQGSWYGYPEANVVVPRSTVSRASFPALAGYAGDATTLQIAVGCFNGTVHTPCTTAAPAASRTCCRGRAWSSTTRRSRARRSRRPACCRAARRGGSDPITLDAADNGGIQRVEIVDLSGGSAVVGAEDYAAGARTDTGATCSPRLRKACPNLKNETVRPTAWPAGRRTLKVRVIDAADNVTEQGPVRGRRRHAVRPRAVQRQRRHRRRHAERALRRRQQDAQDGRLSQARDGHGPAAELLRRADLRRRAEVLTRDQRSNAQFVERWTATTDSDGIYRVKVRAAASRLVQVAWASHIHDPSPQVNAYVTPQRPRRLVLAAREPRVGRRRAHAAAERHGPRRRALARRAADLPGPRRRRGRYTTFADGRADRRGRFKIRYRFRSGGSRGRTFTFRVKLRGDARFPYALGYSTRVQVRVR